MNRSVLSGIISGILLALAIVLCPDQYLFSKIVPNSFWVKYFPLPFGAGWFITFIVLIPAIWLSSSLSEAEKSGLAALIAAIMMAVPISIIMVDNALTLNNFLYQYIWAGIICFPPYLLHLLLRWLVSKLQNR